MSLLKVNEVQNYNGSSLTLTASTVSTSAQLNTGGNISVTGSINVSDDSTTRSNLGLGSIATQAANAVDIDGGAIDGTTIGGTSAAAGTFTTFTSTGIDDNASSTAITIAPSGAIMYSGGVYAATKRVTSFALTGGGSTDTLFDLWSGDAGRGHYLISVTRAGANVGARSLVIVASGSSSVSSLYSVLDSTGITVGVSGSDVTASYSGASIIVNAIAIPLAIDGN